MPATPSARRGTLLSPLRPYVWFARSTARDPSRRSVARLRREDELTTGLLIRMSSRTPERPLTVVEHLVDVEGGQIPIRLYRPFGSGPLPVHLFFHGGGWVVGGNLGLRDKRCRSLAGDVPCVVASVGYRLAPEHPFPTGVEDAYRALCSLADQAGELGLDRTRISVGGESAGGNIAAVLALMTRDRHGPPLVFQVLDVPVTDLRMDSRSYQENGQGFPLTRSEMENFVGHYLSDRDQATHPYASPLLAADLTGLPPAMVTTAEFDLLRDEGDAYARRLAEAGVPVDHHMLRGQVHLSYAMTRLKDSFRRYRECVIALRQAFSEP